MRDKNKYTGPRWILFQDCILSLIASLFSILLVRWLSNPIPGYIGTVEKWLVASLIGSLVGFLFSGSWKIVRRYFTLRSTGNAILAILIKESALVFLLITGLVKLHSTAFSLLAVSTDFIFTALFLLFIRIAAQMISPSDEEDFLKAIGLTTARLHNAGMIHHDYSRGNLLLGKNAEGKACVELIDLNRLRFHEISIDEGCQNFAERLPATNVQRHTMAEAYAKERGFDVERCYELMMKYNKEKT